MSTTKTNHESTIGNYRLEITYDPTLSPDFAYTLAIYHQEKLPYYSYTGSYLECLDRYCSCSVRFEEISKSENQIIEIESPDLSEYYGDRLEVGGCVQLKIEGVR